MDIESKKYTNTEVPDIDLYSRWIDVFAKHLSEEERWDIGIYPSRFNGFLYCYLWQLFTNEEKSYLYNNEADTTFDNIANKKRCFILSIGYANRNFSLYDLTDITANNIKDIGSDIYVIDENFTWTYLKNHDGERFFSRNDW